jgi:hypothetical protein
VASSEGVTDAINDNGHVNHVIRRAPTDEVTSAEERDHETAPDDHTADDGRGAAGRRPLGGARLWVLRLDYLERAEVHAYWCDHLRNPEEATYWEARWTDQREGFKGSYPWPDKPPFVPVMAAYHARMRAKWERAAARPWLSVEPDPYPRNR